MPPVTFGGLASGLDTQALIDAILDFESRPLERLVQRKDLFDRRRSALAELGTKLKSFESALRDLGSQVNFRGRIVDLGDDTVLRATAGSGAQTGLFQVDVTALATASKVKSDGFASANQTLVADGTIQLQAGDGELVSIDVSAASGNNSLEQIRNAINAADAGIQASVIFDGTSSRLVVRSEQTGTANGLSITDSTDLNLGAAGNLVTAAADAALNVDGIDVTSSSNQVSNVIPGVTLDLLSASTGAVSVQVSQDNDRVTENVQNLVEAYNELGDFFNAQLDRERGGALADESIARSIQREVQALFTGGVDGIEFGGIRSLSSVGIDFDATGKASLDESVLRELLDEQFDAVGNLFLTAGQTTDPRIQFLTSTAVTQPGTYDVSITQAAENAFVEGSTPITTLLADETLTVDDGSSSVQVTLAAGLGVSEIVDTLNQSFSDNDVKATAVAVGGKLQIKSQAYGSAATISVSSDLGDSGDGRTTGFSFGGASDVGVDVAGTIGGVTAVGLGQVLTAAEGTEADGTQVRVLANAGAVAATGGDFGTVSFSRGLVSTVLSRVTDLTRSGDGPLQSTRESLTSRIDSINDDIERYQDRLAGREARLAQSFAAAERAIQALQSQQSAIGSFF